MQALFLQLVMPHVKAKLEQLSQQLIGGVAGRGAVEGGELPSAVVMQVVPQTCTPCGQAIFALAVIADDGRGLAVGIAKSGGTAERIMPIRGHGVRVPVQRARVLS